MSSYSTTAEGVKLRNSTKVYFALIVFKNAKEIQPIFEIPDYFQTKISVLYKDINLKMSKSFFVMRVILTCVPV